jgi:hypothetical protein
MKPTPVPVALRAYTVRRPSPETATASPPAAPPLGKRTRSGGRDPRWPRHVLVFDTETTTDAAQRLTFGSYRVLRWLPSGGHTLISEGLFHADDLADWDAPALAELARYAASEGVRLISRRDFMDKVFRRVAIDLEGTVVGFNLPFDLSRLAIESGEARNRYHGGFSFALWDYIDRRTGRHVEHPFRPRICVKSLDSKRAFIGFTRPMRSGEATAKTFRGHFLDLRTLAFALSAKSHSLASACKAFGVEHGKLTVEEHGRVTADYIAYNRRDVLATQELLERLRVEFDQLRLAIPATRAYSPASIAKASLRAMGIRSPQGKAPSITPADYGRCMTAFFGGRAECRVRRVPLPVVTVDFRSMYPTVNCLLGLWPILRAESIRFEDFTDEFRALLAKATPNAAFDPAVWPQLCGFVEIEADADILPVRAKYSDTREGLNIGVNYLTSPVPLIYAAPDVYASALLSGKVPRVRRAWRLVGEGIQAGLTPIALGGRIPVDPRSDDFFRTVIEERVRVKNSEQYSPDERERIAQLLKIVANSGSYGIFAEMTREALPTDTTENISVFGHGASFEQKTNAPEDLGEFCFPPIAALIASAARLMLALLERSVTDMGGTYAFCDTDSMAIIATRTGGLLECEGGTADTTDRIEAIRALTWQNVASIQARFNALNPYDRSVIPAILNIEDVNYQDGVQRELFAFVISAKRYALFTWREDRTIQLEKCSEHGLGHLLSPISRDGPDKWPGILWQLILCKELNIPEENPDWLECPAVSRLSVSTPAYFRGFLRGFARMPYAERIKPFGFLLSAQVARFGHPAGFDPKAFHLVAPFIATPRKWASQLWTDTYTGEEFAIATRLSYQQGIVRVRSLADVRAEFLAHGESKSAASNGEPAEREIRGLLTRRHVTPSRIRLIGKESNAWELVEAGMIGHWDDILSSYGGSHNRPSPEMLRSSSAKDIARTFTVSVRTVRAWRRRQREAAERED